MERDISQIKRIYSNKKFEQEQKSNKEVEHLRKVLFSLIGPVRDKKILFIGCGDGKECEPYIIEGAEVTGIDLSESLIESALRIKKGRFLVADFNNFKGSKRFDVVIAILSLQYTKNLEKSLRKVKEMLKKEGELFIATTHPVHKMINYNKGNYFRRGKVWYKWKGILRFNYLYLIEDYVNASFKTGFSLTGMMEVYTPREYRSSKDKKNKFPIFTIYKMKS